MPSQFLARCCCHALRSDLLLGLTRRPEYGGTMGATTDDVCVAYPDSGYYLCDRRYASAGAISISM